MSFLAGQHVSNEQNYYSHYVEQPEQPALPEGQLTFVWNLSNMNRTDYVYATGTDLILDFLQRFRALPCCLNSVSRCLLFICLFCFWFLFFLFVSAD